MLRPSRHLPRPAPPCLRSGVASARHPSLAVSGAPATKSFTIRTYEKRSPNSFRIRTYKETGEGGLWKRSYSMSTSVPREQHEQGTSLPTRRPNVSALSEWSSISFGNFPKFQNGSSLIHENFGWETWTRTRIARFRVWLKSSIVLILLAFSCVAVSRFGYILAGFVP